MLTKENRADRKTIAKIFQDGAFINSPNLTLKFIFDPKLKTPTISFITPKTVSKSAVKRNALRRRGYGVLRGYLNDLPNNLAGVFIFGKNSLSHFAGRKNTKYNPVLNLENEIKNILSKIN
ncbi:hypothetical protein COU49_01445 [Candidatus Nomurabacteria bacterium CG10_big_fil_rev_8_21_14_0_10_35_16]|uniref:Uncharacterized protein n=1 Tax=Candidatus Nomurabacteria bacterium CG10_big_fil_rev_8_21_14_0_10_35_16 TaxID=1974731 RepID=A0A2H0TBI3_9BACT|nr:MAG: hypothetical protein COU49_01445 [Candidatus Nomurabacteria bacterium CG10_big_fil_rev_8_21_14_0_10_35_16]